MLQLVARIVDHVTEQHGDLLQMGGQAREIGVEHGGEQMVLIRVVQLGMRTRHGQFSWFPVVS